MPELSKDQFDAVMDSAFATTAKLHETLLKAGCIVVRKGEYEELQAIVNEFVCVYWTERYAGGLSHEGVISPELLARARAAYRP